MASFEKIYTYAIVTSHENDVMIIRKPDYTSKLIWEVYVPTMSRSLATALVQRLNELEEARREAEEPKENPK